MTGALLYFAGLASLFAGGWGGLALAARFNPDRHTTTSKENQP